MHCERNQNCGIGFQIKYADLSQTYKNINDGKKQKYTFYELSGLPVVLPVEFRITDTSPESPVSRRDKLLLSNKPLEKASLAVISIAMYPSN